jgi:hypothetical protein
MNNQNENLKLAIEKELNKACAENGSDTPDFILAQYLMDCLDAFDNATFRRTKFYYKDDKEG